MLIYSGPFSNLSGYAQASRSYIKAFYEAGLDLKTHLRSYDHKPNEKYIDQNELDLCYQLRVDRIPHNQSFNFLCHSSPNAAFTVPARKNILYSVWESSHIPEEFIPFLSPFDLILTASEFSRQAFLATCPQLNIHVLPHIIIDYSKVNFNIADNLREKSEDKFVFLWNGEWIKGKGYDIVLNAFLKAFSNNKDVLLILKTYNLGESNYHNRVVNYIRDSKKGKKYPSILPLIGDLSRHECLSLYSLADVFINSSRREGWGLCSSEAIGFELPVIAPDKGGHREFLNEQNSLLFNSQWQMVQDLEPQRILYKGQEWIEPDINDLIDKLKYIYNNYNVVKNKLNLRIKETICKFNSNNIVNEFIKWTAG